MSVVLVDHEFVYYVHVGNGPDDSTEVDMAKQDELPGVPAVDPELVQHPGYKFGLECGFLLKLGRRASVPVSELRTWSPETLFAFKAGVSKGMEQ